MSDPTPMQQREMRLIGCVLFDRFAFDSAVAAGVEPADFTVSGLPRIWRACLDEAGENRAGAVDLVTVAERLHREGNLEACGNFTGLQELVAAVVSGYRSCVDARLVRERGVMRRSARDGSVLIGQAERGEAEPEEVRGWAEGMVRNLAPKPADRPESVSETLDRIGDGPRADLIRSGVHPLDQKIGGFSRGSLVIVAGKPGFGKTSLMLDIARHAADDGRDVAVFSLEMSREEISARLCSQESGLSSLRLLTGSTMSQEERGRYAAARARIASYPLTLHESPALTVHDLRRSLDMADPCPALVVLDYLQQMPTPRGLKDHESISQNVRELKRIARAMNAVMVVGSQFSREGEELENLSGSSEIEKAADLVLTIRRPKADEPARVLQISKNRNGPRGRWTLDFREEATTFDPA